MTDSLPDPASGRVPARRRWPRVAVAAAVSVVTITVAATVALGSDAGGGRYRTAVAAIQDTIETLDEVGTIQPVSQVDVAFPDAGTIATVDVAVGDRVAVGDVLATLDPESLEADVRAAQSALDQAELDLERARNGETVTGTPNAGVVGLSSTSAVTATLTAQTDPPTGPSATTQSADGGGPTTTGQDSDLAAAQQAVLDAQRVVDAALRNASEKLATAQQICAALGQQPAATTTTTTTTTAPAEPTEPTEQVSACYDALAIVLDAQRATQAAQDDLADAAAALDALRAERAADSGTSGTPESTPGDDPQRAPSSDSDGQPSSTPASDSPSSEDLIALQKAIDEAELDLVVAEHALAHNRIVSPIAGTVVAVGFDVGDTVDGGSDQAVITVAGDGGYEVTATVSVDDLPDLELGQRATVVPDGSTGELQGELVAVGLVASSATSGTTYDVTIGFTDATDDLRNGSVASIEIAIDEGTGVLSVPTSAVKADNGDHHVTVLRGDIPEQVTIEIGAVGATWTEITDGLDPGDVVVIADLDEPLPGSANSGAATGDGLGGGPGVGGGAGGGGFPGRPAN